MRRFLLRLLLAVAVLVPGIALAKSVVVRSSLVQAQQTTETYQVAASGNRCFRLYLNISAETGTATLDVKLQGQDPATTTWVDIPGASLAQKTGTTSAPATLTLCPGIAETVNETVSDAVPDTVRVVAVSGTGAGSGTFVYSLGAQLTP